MEKVILLVDVSPIYMLGVAGVIHECASDIQVHMAETCWKAADDFREGVYAVVMSDEIVKMRGWQTLKAAIGSEPILLITSEDSVSQDFAGMNVRGSMRRDVKRDAAVTVAAHFLSGIGRH